jgi:hypothetical protein
MNSPTATVIALIATIWLAMAAYWWLGDTAHMLIGRWVLTVLGTLGVVTLAVALWRWSSFSIGLKLPQQ